VCVCLQELDDFKEVAMSVFAAVTAKIMQLGLLMYFRISSRICSSISLGWSPTGT